MRKLPSLFEGVRAWLTRRPDQDLIDATEDLMVNGPPLTEEQKKLRGSIKSLYDTLNKAPLKPDVMYIPEDVYDDIVSWGKGSPSGEGQVE